jgi:DNA-binding transcriptional LysR family regulator
LRQLKYFLAVAKHQSLERASKALQDGAMAVEPSPLGRQIKKLEKYLGVDLFVHKRNSITLTSAGSAYTVQANIILDAAARAKHAIRSLPSSMIRTIHVGYDESPTEEFREKAFSLFEAKHREIQVVPYEMSNASQRAVSAAELDLALIVDPFRYRKPLMFEKVTDHELCCVLRSGHAHASDDWVPVRALRREKFLILSRSQYPLYHENISKALRPHFRPNITGEYDSLRTLVAAVARGHGISLFFPPVGKMMKDHGVRVLPCRPSLGRFNVGALYLSPPSPIVTAMLTAVRTALSELEDSRGRKT